MQVSRSCVDRMRPRGAREPGRREQVIQLGRCLDALREVATLVRQHVPNDLVPGAAATTNTRPELRRDAAGRLVELVPGRAQQAYLTIECRRIEWLPVERRGRERDAPEVGRAGPRVPADDVELRLGGQLRSEADPLRDREVPRHVARELLDRLV